MTLSLYVQFSEIVVTRYFHSVSFEDENEEKMDRLVSRDYFADNILFNAKTFKQTNLQNE